MNKKMLFGFLMLVSCGTGVLKAQSVRIDSLAVYILQQTAAHLQSIESCNFTAEIGYDVWSDELGYVRHSYEDVVAMKFPSKMRIASSGDKGNRSLWCDGKKMYYYSRNKNHYASVNAPNNIVQTMDTLNKRFGLEFPAADFFYPTFLEDIINTGSSLVYLGISKVNGKDCFHIIGKNTTSSFQFWIDGEDAFFLPVKMLITYFEKDGGASQQYEAIYGKWTINSNLPDSMFEFVVPPYATEVNFFSTKADSKH